MQILFTKFIQYINMYISEHVISEIAQFASIATYAIPPLCITTIINSAMYVPT